MMQGSAEVLLDPSRQVSRQLDGANTAALACPAAQTPRTLSSDNQAVDLLGGPATNPALLEEFAVTGRIYVTPDDMTMAAIVERLFTVAGLPADQKLAISMLNYLAIATGLAVGSALGAPYNPNSPPSPDGLTQLLREAAGYSAQGIPSLEEARRLADYAINGLTGLLGVTPAQFVAMSLKLEVKVDLPTREPDDPALDVLEKMWEEPDPDDSSHPIWGEDSAADASDPLQKLLPTPAALQIAAAIPIPDVTFHLLGLLGVNRFRRLIRLSVPWRLRTKLREYDKSRAGLPAQSQSDGFLVENQLRLLYLGTVAPFPSEVLAGSRIGTGAVTLGDAATTNPLWAVVKTGLLSFLSGRVGAPDILDANKRHVYEIKPMGSAVQAAQRLYGRYLFWLNLLEVALSNPTFGPMELAAWAARAAGLNFAPPFPLRGRVVAPPKFWVPGPWVPPPSLMVADGRVSRIEVPTPGIICYELPPKKEKPAEATELAKTPDVDLVMRVLVAMLVMWGLLESGRRSGRVPQEQVARYFELDFGPGVDPEFEALESTLKLALIIVAVVAVVLGGAYLAPSLGPVLTKIYPTAGAAGIAAAVAQ